MLQILCHVLLSILKVMKSLFLFLFVYPIVSLNDRQLNMIRNNVSGHDDLIIKDHINLNEKFSALEHLLQ